MPKQKSFAKTWTSPRRLFNKNRRERSNGDIDDACAYGEELRQLRVNIENLHQMLDTPEETQKAVDMSEEDSDQDEKEEKKEFPSTSTSQGVKKKNENENEIPDAPPPPIIRSTRSLTIRACPTLKTRMVTYTKNGKNRHRARPVYGWQERRAFFYLMAREQEYFDHDVKIYDWIINNWQTLYNFDDALFIAIKSHYQLNNNEYYRFPFFEGENTPGYLIGTNHLHREFVVYSDLNKKTVKKAGISILDMKRARINWHLWSVQQMSK